MSKESYYNSKTFCYRMSGGRLREILRVLPVTSGRALDVGCGEGFVSKELTKRGWHVTGVDIIQGADFSFDIERDDWPEALMAQRFDLVLCSEVIEHVFSPEDLMAHIRTLMADKGSAIITTPNVLFWKNRLKMLLGVFRYEERGILDFGHIRLFTIDTARDLFQKAGLRIEEESHVYPNLHHRGLDFLGRMFPGLFAYQMVFRLSKRT